MRYDKYLTIESFGFALGELSAAASIWRDIAPGNERRPPCPPSARPTKLNRLRPRPPSRRRPLATKLPTGRSPGAGNATRWNRSGA